MNYELRTNKAFTLIELTVAVALLAIMMGFSGVIFKVSIESHRLAAANAQIMQKFRAITDQLNADFKGLRKDAPLFIFFRQDPYEPAQRYDQIMFFADGDFQSTQLYDDLPGLPIGREPALTGWPVRGNVARIYYGQARSLDPLDNIIKYPFYIGVAPNEKYQRYRILARRQHILTADERFIIWPDPANIPTSFNQMHYNPYHPAGVRANEHYEHDRLSLSLWKTLDSTAYGTFGGTILNTCFDELPLVDMTNTVTISDTIHKLVAEGLGSFSIQWAYFQNFDNPVPIDDRWLWFPSEDPDGTGSFSHFDLVRIDGIPFEPAPGPAYNAFKVFGAIFNIPGADQINYWAVPSKMRYDLIGRFPADFFPKALKFTFTLYDSKGVIENGRTFTHIVYLDD